MNSSNPTPLVTVVTVTYQLVKNNRVPFFRTCVESVRSQSYPAIEHLVIDGGSDDGTVELIREYEQQGALTCISEPDKGIYDAMNKGIRLARGKYLAFLNSDDYWHGPDGVAQSVEMLERTQSDFSYAIRTCVSLEGEPLRTEYPQIGSFPYTMPFCHQTMFTRTELLRQMGGFRFPKYRSAADYDLVVRLLLGGAKPVYVPHNFTSFRMGGFSTEADGGEDISRREVEMIVREHFGPFMEESDDLKWIWEPYPPVPVEVLRAIETMVHPTVAMQFHGYALGPWQDFKCIRAGRPAMEPQWGLYIPESTPSEGGGPVYSLQVRTWKLFNILPILSVKSKAGSTRVFLFGLTFLYLMKILTRENKRTFYLFDFLPVLQIRTRYR